MNFNDVRQYVRNVLTQSFTNKGTLDKLSSEDGKLMFDNKPINSGVVEGDLYYSYENYSTTEAVIGCWTDGKPVYKRCIRLNEDISLVASEWVNTNIACNNYVFLRALYAPIVSNYPALPLQIANQSNMIALMTYRSSQNLSATNGLLIVEYTKTTDAENSFTPSMITNNILVPTVSYEKYSIDETIVGEWIDGAKIYKKVLVGNTFSEDKENELFMDLSELNIDNVLDLKVNANVTSVLNKDSYVYFYYDKLQSGLIINQSGEIYQNIPIYIILEYTKEV